jgi:hypothetical protein
MRQRITSIIQVSFVIVLSRHILRIEQGHVSPIQTMLGQFILLRYDIYST